MSLNGFTQMISGPTHIRNHTLDLVFVREEDLPLWKSPTIAPNSFSEHHTIFLRVTANSSLRNTDKPVINYRNYKAIDRAAFTQDLTSKLTLSSINHHPDEILCHYQETVIGCIDTHAPLRKKRKGSRSHNPWYNAEIHQMRRKRRDLENTWRRSGLNSDRLLFVSCRSKVNDLIIKSKVAYYRDILYTASQKSIFKVVNSLLTNKTTALPTSPTNQKTLCNKFAKFFNDRISDIRTELDHQVSISHPDACPVPSCHCLNTLTELQPASHTELLAVINKSPPKSCSLDFIPTSLLKELISAHLPSLLHLVNASFLHGSFPTELKKAVIIPTLKKPSLDKEQLSNYRPVSNLYFIGKVMERLALKRLNDHLNLNSCHEEMQSAYKAHHSTETALLNVHHDIATALDHNQAVLLILLDLSAAFDTIDISRLLTIIQQQYGVTDKAYEWFASYLQNRSQQVAVGSSLSGSFPLKFGVPQGSVLGPVLFNLYTASLETTIKYHTSVHYHKYADDIQVYVTYNPSSAEDLSLAQRTLTLCINDIRNWMLANRLKLNDIKTKFLQFMSPHQLRKCGLTSIVIGNTTVHASTQCKNLGVMFDTHLAMTAQVTALCKKCNFHLRRIKYVRKYLTTSATRHIVQALVLSNIDYCNSLLSSIPAYLLRRLQKIQNWAARIITRGSFYDHITPVLNELHWLPVQQRIKFKILLIIWKSINSQAPSYLSRLVSFYQRDSRLRSLRDPLTLNTPTCSKSVGRGAFGYIGPRLWNDLPYNIRSSTSAATFKKLLKTELYRI